ncbi:glycoside hydrolase family 31 protein [Streptomyces oryzae]|uniref:Glycoside hydrolase family 31 protein n=1 Tax=Streptomyces oryzae TaxID=1434886 RepID=A0ABS3X6K3_9ACTN|nr:glycoside hydrolase family 31 protein [Streptomyces oryzae]MBO8190990.1 glycoside hydrolase family 31 protein [Streptomyces oryzae]
MEGRGQVRSVTVVGAGGRWPRMRALRAAWRGQRTDARRLPRQRAERARTPGEAAGAEPGPGGGRVTFARSVLDVRVTVGGAVFLGWDGAAPEPSYALVGACPEPDPRARLEPDKDGGWRVVSERMLVIVSRHGAVEMRTPGGALLRRDQPPRWWESVALEAGEQEAGEAAASGAEEAGGIAAGAGPRWMQRSELPCDARFFGLGGRAAGPRLRAGRYRLWNTDAGPCAPGADPLSVTMPVLVSVADAGTLLVFHDNPWDGSVTVREGAEGQGSAHDRPARCEVRMDGGPMRYWVVAGAPSRVLHGWAALTGAPAVPPRWALGHQHLLRGAGGEREVRELVDGHRERGLPLGALHLDAARGRRSGGFPVGAAHFPGLRRAAAELREAGVRLVSVVEPGVRAEAGDPVFDSGAAAGLFVRDERERTVRAGARRREAVFPDFTDRRVRKWWGELYAEPLEQGFAGVWHTGDEPVSPAAFGDRTLPLSARHALEGRGGDHREGHNVYALTMAKAGFAGLRELRPSERPFVLARAGWAGIHRYGGARAAELETGWAGLRATLSLVLGLGLCGVPYAGPDVGGDTARPSPELYLRWFQLAAYLPLFRTRTGPGGRGVPWGFGEEVLEHARAALAERERLEPYLLTLAQLAHRTGAPYVRPVWWQHPRDRALRDCEDAFLLGDALLVAPVLEPGVRSRTVRLPAGLWYDTGTGRAHRGPAAVRVAAPLGRIPVLARAGAAVPVRGPGGRTELEVWPPAPGRAGEGLLIPDPGEGWERPVAERFTVRRAADGAVVAERDDGGAVEYGVRVRGSGGGSVVAD